MRTKKLHGKDGKLILAYKGVHFADAERITAELEEQAALIPMGNAGAYHIGAGYKAVLRLNDVTVTDDDTLSIILRNLKDGSMPEFDFQGIFRRGDGMAERIIFRNCALTGEIDLVGLAGGFVWDLDLAVNSLDSQQLEAFQAHG